jgi:hypothetical protein
MGMEVLLKTERSGWAHRWTFTSYWYGTMYFSGYAVQTLVAQFFFESFYVGYARFGKN